MKHEAHFPRPMPSRRPRCWLGLGSVAASLLAPAWASAQVVSADIAPPPPNVLLLVDSSGSMDYKTGSNEFPICSYDGVTPTGQASERSRWIDLVEVLTGSIDSYACQKLNRSSSLFIDEYRLGGSRPYDALYPNPYHRPVSGTCVAGPDVGNPSGAVQYHPVNSPSGACSFAQSSDGVLDAFRNDVRFGLMTFDTEPDAGLGVEGLWSYYLTSPATGRPADCPTPPVPQEVGVRNHSAPLWEGRAIGFGNPASGSTDYQARNAMIQEVLLATRPYGATPIAGMLDDARQFFLHDTSPDPLDGSFHFGPSSDPAACRKKSIILLSDGQPNLDLRPHCEAGELSVDCPYDKSEDIAEALREAGIDLFVIGFALPDVTVGGVTMSCSDLTDEDLDSENTSGACFNPGDSALQACCALNRIAAAGGYRPTSAKDPDWTRAHFANDRDELRKALAQAIGTNFPPTTRSPVVNATGAGYVGPGADLNFARAFRFGTSFSPASLDQIWTGGLTRGRYVCKVDEDDVFRPVLLDVDSNAGDDFVLNVNFSGPDARKIYTVVGDDDPSVKSAANIRPNLELTVDDGLGNYSGTFELHTSSGFVSAVPAEAMKVVDGRCGLGTTAVQCRNRYLKWLVGLDNETVNHRCPSAATCNLIGDFLHSTPRAVPGRPSELLNDASYEAFRELQATNKRPSVLYASSNDGFLHAFKIGPVGTDPAEPMKVKSKETNELWTFVPPATLPEIPGFYPGSHQLLLDGSPVIKDVVATEKDAATGYEFALERSKTDAQAGTGTWRTILVQSFGAQRPGYFALDVTDPVPDGGTGGPKFLWQLTNEEGKDAIFGSGGGTPLITTVYLGSKEVAVAVLPGGFGAPATGGPCPRQSPGTVYAAFTTGYVPRNEVPCYTQPSSVAARSLTVVRLDTGEILRTFRRDDDEVPALKARLVVTEAPLDSPLTGQPIPFPSDVGAVADRVFIGDQDGAMWRLNFATATGAPSDWKLELFFDGFPGDGAFDHDWGDGQPITTPPIISVNAVGNLTVAFSTGDQTAIGAVAGQSNYVWSLTEQPNAERTQLLTRSNWYLRFPDTGELAGDRVIGTMALFGGDLYFSTMGKLETSAGACAQGEGKLWGMHYLLPQAEAGKGGVVARTIKIRSGTKDYLNGADLLGTTGATAFLSGVSIGQEPTCENVGGDPTDNEYFSYGTAHHSLGAPAGGKFQLFVPTGNQLSQSTASGLTPIDQGGARGVAIDLESPAVSTRVDSWAAIVE